MSQIIAVKAYANNEVAFVAWTLKQPIVDCLGFEVTRIYPASGEQTVLAAWVPFKGQSNRDWKPQTTSVWPVQKMIWRDLTVRKRRDQTELRPSDVVVKYRVRPLVKQRNGLDPVKSNLSRTYTGAVVPLSYFDEGMESNEALVTSAFGAVTATFTNGILSAQWLRHALEENEETLSVQSVTQHIQDPNDKIRRYLSGDVPGTLKRLIERAADTPGAKVFLALYELSDNELVDTLIAHKDVIHVILSNSSKSRDGDAWDFGNKKARELLKKAGVDLQNRMFNNGHIGHNKFAVLVEGHKATAVMTGSTNWTPTGLCGQSNNAAIIASTALAADYLAYWNRLKDDTDSDDFKTPRPLSAKTSNKQGPEIRREDAKDPDTHTLDDQTRITAWFSPNTERVTKGVDPPPDLDAVYSLMRKAQRAILFACFLPSRSGKTSIIEEAISIGMKDSSLLVYGAVSDPTAMPNYVAKKKGEESDDDDEAGTKKPQPALYDKGNIHVIRAAALTKDDIVGDFEYELLKTGNAIIHDKIVVVDPLSDDGFVVFGSHNLGYKASYENDENLLIVQGNRPLVEAYAVHVLDIYEHYRFRAAQQELRREGKKPWQGFLSVDDKWLGTYLASGRADLARYFCGT